MFMKLSSSDHLVQYIINSFNSENKIFMLFDTVHILKCICNTCLNVKDNDRAFVFPDFDDNSVIRCASFSDLTTLCSMEKNLTIKQSYLLSWKYLYPNSIERRNVKLALKIFDRSTIAALESLESTNSGFNKSQDTVIFIKLILKFWNIVNTKSTTKGHK